MVPPKKLQNCSESSEKAAFCPHIEVNLLLIRHRYKFLLKKVRIKFGGASRDRTDDLLDANQTLSQLSYGPKKDA
tara:strand:+ start:361 stop:585 length:225 start_codon:yes stop_codon:yes gene_type:complete